MASYRAAVACAVLVGFSAPAAMAGWGVKGEVEPNTPYDAQDGYMFLEPDRVATSGRHVYFNGFMGTYAGVATHLSPNAAALDTRIQPYPAEAWAALGVWKDCNGDGYIGWGDQGLWEYRAELLTLPGMPGDSICPNEGEIDLRYPYVSDSWRPPHNDGRWVHEFIAIGWRDWRDSVDLNVWHFNDSDARVWADYGLPSSRQTLVCSVDPAPTGTYQSTGGFLAYADCFTAYKLTTNVNDLARGSTLLAPLSFEDQPMGKQGQSRSVLNVKNPWGRQGDAAVVSAWDCSAPPAAQPRDPTWNGESGPTHVMVQNPLPAGSRELWVNLSNGQGDPGISVTSVVSAFVRVNVSQPRAPPGVDSSGSPAGTVNDTQSSTGNCHRHDNTGPGLSHTPYALEGSVVVRGATRVSSDFTLHYEMGRSRAGPHTLTGRGAPPDWGVKLTGREACYNTGVLYQIWCYDGLWHDTLPDTTRAASTPNPYADRDTLAPEPVTHVTYYAHIGAAAVSTYGFRLPGTVGSYGSEGCAQSPPTFECDPSLWWPGNTIPRTGWLGRDPDDPARSRPYGVRVGQTYHLRDIDCHDQGIGPLRDEGLTWGAITGTAC